MPIPQQFHDSLLEIRNDFLEFLKEKLRDENWESFKANRPAVGRYPDEETINQCWDEFLIKVAIYIDTQPSSDVQTNGYGPNMWWLYCYFGLMLYHFSHESFPWMTALKIIIIQLEKEIRFKVPKESVSDLHGQMTKLSSYKNWAEDLDGRAFFLYLNIQDRIAESKL